MHSNKLWQLAKQPLFILSLSALVFGWWFARMQVQVIAPQALEVYPLQYFLLTVLKCYLTIAVFFVSSTLLLSYISNNKITHAQVALSYLPLMLVYAHISIGWIVVFILAFHAGLIYSTLSRENYQYLSSRYSVDITVLLFLFICHLFLTTALSPLHWKVAMLTMDGFNGEEVPIVVPLFKGFVSAKQFSFSNVDHSQWAGMMHPAVSLTSPLLQLIAFIWDVPSVSYQAFHVLVNTIYFILIVLGAFGFYLFLKYAAKLHLLFAVLGGFLFYFSGAPLLHLSFHADAGIFISAQSCFPYALLFISLAFERNNWRFSALAGLSMAAQFFFFAPHPEATIYLFLFYSIYTFGLFVFSRNLPWKNKFYLGAISYLSFLALSAFYLTPIMVDRLMGNMYAFAHVRDITFTYMKFFVSYIRLIIIFAPLSFVLLYLYKRLSPVYLSSLLLAICLAILVSLTTYQPFNVGLVHLLNLGLHIWVPTRPGVYLYVVSFIVALIGLDILTHAICDVMYKKNFLRKE